MNELITNYETKMNEYMNRLENDHIILEITKLCGYSCIYPVHRSSTIYDVYRIISQLFQREIRELFFINERTREKINLPFASSMLFRAFISRCNESSNQIIPPVYPLPCKIVYRIYCDDGHFHGSELCQLLTSVSS